MKIKYIIICAIQLKQCSEKTLTVLNTHMRDTRSQKTILLYTQTNKIRKKINTISRIQYFGHLMLGKIEGRRRRQQRMRWLDGITD